MANYIVLYLPPLAMTHPAGLGSKVHWVIPEPLVEARRQQAVLKG